MRSSGVGGKKQENQNSLIIEENSALKMANAFYNNEEAGNQIGNKSADVDDWAYVINACQFVSRLSTDEVYLPQNTFNKDSMNSFFEEIEGTDVLSDKDENRFIKVIAADKPKYKIDGRAYALLKENCGLTDAELSKLSTRQVVLFASIVMEASIKFDQYISDKSKAMKLKDLHDMNIQTAARKMAEEETKIYYNYLADNFIRPKMNIRGSILNARQLIKIDLDNLKNDERELLHRFFQDCENNKNFTLFEKGQSYPFENIDIQFNQELIRYEKNKKNVNDKVEYIYSVFSEKSLGSGGYGTVKKASGKLIHSNNNMIYITPKDLKSGYQFKIISVVDLVSMDKNVLINLADDKTPILIKDNKTMEVRLFGRKDNRWVITPLDKTKFKNIQFPQFGESVNSKDINVDQNNYEEMHKGHTRKSKAIKRIVVQKGENAASIQQESDIGLATGDKGTKKASLIKYGNIEEGFIVMDVAPGITLDEVIKKGKLTPEQRLDLSINLMKALKKYHDTGFIHRDIKPGNIMIDMENGMQVRIIDHGGSRRIDTPDKKQIATTLYVSPEMMIKPEDAGIESDYYSMSKVIKMLWGDKEIIEESKLGEYQLILKRGSEYNKTNEKNKPELDVNLSKEPLRSLIADVLHAMTDGDPKKRMDIQDGLSELIRIKEINDINLGLLNKLGGSSKGKTSQFGSSDLNEMANEIKLYNIPPHLMLCLFQNIFKAIIVNENQSYNKPTLRTYSDTQREHLQILMDAYSSYLNNYLSKLVIDLEGIKNINRQDVIQLKNELELLCGQLIFDQDINQNPYNINNNSHISRFGFADTNLHGETDEVIIRLKTHLRSIEKYLGAEKNQHAKELDQKAILEENLTTLLINKNEMNLDKYLGSTITKLLNFIHSPDNHYDSSIKFTLNESLSVYYNPLRTILNRYLESTIENDDLHQAIESCIQMCHKKITEAQFLLMEYKLTSIDKLQNEVGESLVGTTFEFFKGIGNRDHNTKIESAERLLCGLANFQCTLNSSHKDAINNGSFGKLVKNMELDIASLANRTSHCTQFKNLEISMDSKEIANTNTNESRNDKDNVNVKVNVNVNRKGI